jgi:hypothetical protein
VTTRHTQETIGATGILLLCGSALWVLSRHWGVGSDLMSQIAAFAGPVGVVLGVGLAVHGKKMPRRLKLRSPAPGGFSALWLRQRTSGPWVTLPQVGPRVDRSDGRCLLC